MLFTRYFTSFLVFLTIFLVEQQRFYEAVYWNTQVLMLDLFNVVISLYQHI